MAHEMAIAGIQQDATVTGVELSIWIRFHQLPLIDQNPNFQNTSVPISSCWLLVTGCWLLASGSWLVQRQKAIPKWAPQGAWFLYRGLTARQPRTRTSRRTSTIKHLTIVLLIVFENSNHQSRVTRNLQESPSMVSSSLMLTGSINLAESALGSSCTLSSLRVITRVRTSA